MIKGKNTFVEQHDWIEANRKNKILLKLFGKKEIKAPSPSTLHRIAINIDNNALENVFRSYFDKHVSKKNIAVDGKWLNGSRVTGQYINESKKIMFNIVDKDTKLCIGHKLVGVDKKSEGAVFQDLLDNKEFFCRGQVFSFDALTTQARILETINSDGNKYIAYVKGNQKNLLKKVIATIEIFEKPTEVFENDEDDYTIEGNNMVQRRVEIYQNPSCNLVMYDKKFKNIQTIIKTIKTTIDSKTGEFKYKTNYAIANYKESAEEFKTRILQHWIVETHHFFLDTMLDEDDHNAYKNPHGMSILRGFALNLWQLFFNKHKGEKLNIDGVQKHAKLTMARLKSYCSLHDEFPFELFEL
jgi:hypothetical protein